MKLAAFHYFALRYIVRKSVEVRVYVQIELCILAIQFKQLILHFFYVKKSNRSVNKLSMEYPHNWSVITQKLLFNTAIMLYIEIKVGFMAYQDSISVRRRLIFLVTILFICIPLPPVSGFKVDLSFKNLAKRRISSLLYLQLIKLENLLK